MEFWKKKTPIFLFLFPNTKNGKNGRFYQNPSVCIQVPYLIFSNSYPITISYSQCNKKNKIKEMLQHVALISTKTLSYVIDISVSRNGES